MKQSLTELAKKHGHFRAPHVSEDLPFDAAHSVAAVFHKWALHQHRTGVEMQLEDDDYLLAIDSAAEGAVHEPAAFGSK